MICSLMCEEFNYHTSKRRFGRFDIFKSISDTVNKKKLKKLVTENNLTIIIIILMIHLFYVAQKYKK